MIAALVIAFVAFVLIGAISGRVKVQNCCALTADPAKDARLRDASEPPEIVR